MPATYSINDNTAYEAARLATIGDVLNQLPDNTNKLISPKDARDAIYSSWETSVFKQLTGSASIEYIGVDKNGLNNKILLGKKQLGGVDVLNSTLLNYSFNDTDIFFFNNKSGVTPSNTKVSFLAGTNSVLYPYAPYINSYQGTSSLHLEVVNQTGDITIDSSTGRVSINNVTFPTKLETASASNGQILKYYNGRLIWDNNTINLASIGSTNSITNINGSPVLVNGHSLELTESSPIIATFGNIEPGQTFSNAPLVEVVRQMLYPHLGPDVSLLINVNSTGWTTSAVAEFGNIHPSDIELAWSITKKSDPIIFATLSNAYLGGFAPTLPITYPGLTSISGVSLGYTPSTSMTYTLSVYDSGVTNYELNSMAMPDVPTTTTTTAAPTTTTTTTAGPTTTTTTDSPTTTTTTAGGPTTTTTTDSPTTTTTTAGGPTTTTTTDSPTTTTTTAGGPTTTTTTDSPTTTTTTFLFPPPGPTTTTTTAAPTTTTTTTAAPTTTTTTTAYACPVSDFYSYINPDPSINPSGNYVTIVSNGNIQLTHDNLIPGNLTITDPSSNDVSASPYLVGTIIEGTFSVTFDAEANGFETGLYWITIKGIGYTCDYKNPHGSLAGVYITKPSSCPVNDIIVADSNFVTDHGTQYITVVDPNSVLVWTESYHLVTPALPVTAGYLLIKMTSIIPSSTYYISVDGCLYTVYT